MDLSERIQEIVKYTSLSIPKYAQAIGAQTPQAIRDLISGKTKSISADMQHKILSYSPEINPAWLFTGEGDMLTTKACGKPTQNNTEDEYTNKVPLIPIPALANSLAEFFGSGVMADDCQRITSPSPGAELAITISGDSMEPKFHDGMVVFLKRINDAAFIPWGNALVLDTENGAYLKNIFPCEDDEEVIEARSINPAYPPMRIPKSSIFGIYRILNATKFFATM